MQKMILGRTGLEISRTGFGALPIQRVTFEEAAALLNRAVDGGICYIDTARAYTDSEEKIGRALSGRRSEFYIATKTHAKTGANLNADLETSLKLLNTDVIDVYQFHNPPFVPVPGGEDGLYDAAVKAREAGKIRFIGITQHSIERAEQAVESGLYDTLQYPFNHLATEREIALVRRCQEKNVGFVAMKALSGGLVTDARLPFAFLSQFENAVPIWGFQKMEELEQLLYLSSEHPIGLTDEIQSLIQKDLFGAGRLVLPPQLRLLHALPGRHPDQPSQPHEAAARPRGLAELRHALLAKGDGAHRGLHPLRGVRQALSV